MKVVGGEVCDIYITSQVWHIQVQRTVVQGACIVNVQGIQFLLFPIPLSLTGRLLFDYLCHKSSVSETAVCGLMTQLLEALHYLHSHLIVHLDVRVRPSTHISSCTWT